MLENYQLLANVIAAHPDGEIVGRTRLQKTIRLLQRVGLPFDYNFSFHFYGPYSEELRSDINILHEVGLITEEPRLTRDGDEFFILRATQPPSIPEVSRFSPIIERLAASETVVLELASTYDFFRETGSDHADALRRLRAKKGSKCETPRLENALALLREINLPSS